MTRQKRLPRSLFFRGQIGPDWSRRGVLISYDGLHLRPLHLEGPLRSPAGDVLPHLAFGNVEKQFLKA